MDNLDPLSSSSSVFVGKDDASGDFFMLVDKEIIPLIYKIKREIPADASVFKRTFVNVKNRLDKDDYTKEVTVTLGGSEKVTLYVDLRKTSASLQRTKNAFNVQELDELFKNREKAQERISSGIRDLKKELQRVTKDATESISKGMQSGKITQDDRITKSLKNGEPIQESLVPPGATRFIIKRYNKLIGKLLLLRYDQMRVNNEAEVMAEKREYYHNLDRIFKLENQSIKNEETKKELRELQKDNFFLKHKDDWCREALLRPRGVLFNKHTEDGQSLLTKEFQGSSFGEKYDIQAFIVRYHPTQKDMPMTFKDFEICVREESARVHGKGSFKKVVHAVVWKSSKTYAWYILRGDYVIKKSQSKDMAEFYSVIEKHAAFYSPTKSTETYEGHGPKHRGRRGANINKQVALGEEYEGSLKKVREARERDSSIKTKNVLNGDALVTLSAGLDHIHKFGFVLRDIKPDNFLLKGSKVVFADYDLVKKTENVRSIGGTDGYMPLSFVFSDIFGFDLSAHALQPSPDKNGLEQGDLFATALSFWKDLEPKIGTWGLDSSLHNTYIKQIARLIQFEYQFPQELRDFFGKLAGRPGSISSEERSKGIALVRTHEKALLKVWLDRKTEEHELRKPTSGDFLPYRQLLWRATHPDPALQPTPAEFALTIRGLKALGKLPS